MNESGRVWVSADHCGLLALLPFLFLALSDSAPRAATASGRDPINTFSVMEDVLDKLKLLDYEDAILKKRTDLKPLSRTYFALTGKPAEQFPYFAQIAVWSLQQIGVEMEWSEWDDPTATGSAIYDQLKRLQFPYLLDFPPAKLRAGSGEGPVAVLDFLLDRVLDSRGFRVQPPIYGESGGGSDLADQAPIDEEDEDEIGDDTIPDDIPVDDDIAYSGGTLEEKVIDPEDEDRKALEAKSNPIEWALELERVGPKLKFKNTPANKEWRTHLEQSQKHGETLTSAFPPTKGALEKIGSNLRKAAERISTKERSLNKEFEHLGSEFRGTQSNLDSLQESYNSLQREIAELTQELADKTDAIEQIKNNVSDRNNTMTDVSPLRKINTALTQLKKEVQEMELRIGVVAQTLLQAKLKNQHNHQKRDN